MKKVSYVGITAGCISGLIGAVLVSNYDFSIFTVGVIGLIVGALIGWIFSLFK
jgi:tetrahydromethanopterin S-methyltransferase subunit C